MAQQRRLVHYSGTVHGVGFRFTALRVAADYDVTGYVKNLRDGRVEVVAEGPPDQIDAFLAELSKRMGYYIRQTKQQEAQPTGEFGGFDVRF